MNMIQNQKTLWNHRTSHLLGRPMSYMREKRFSGLEKHQPNKPTPKQKPSNVRASDKHTVEACNSHLSYTLANPFLGWFSLCVNPEHTREIKYFWLTPTTLSERKGRLVWPVWIQFPWSHGKLSSLSVAQFSPVTATLSISPSLCYPWSIFILHDPTNCPILAGMLRHWHLFSVYQLPLSTIVIHTLESYTATVYLIPIPPRLFLHLARNASREVLQEPSSMLPWELFCRSFRLLPMCYLSLAYPFPFILLYNTETCSKHYFCQYHLASKVHLKAPFLTYFFFISLALDFKCSWWLNSPVHWHSQSWIDMYWLNEQ